MRPTPALAALLLLPLLLPACSPGPAALPQPAGASAGAVPEAPMTVRPGQRAEARSGMVTAAHPLAAEAGLEMLRAGGNAVDAAVAAAFAVGVVEPMMSGMGGGGAMTLWLEEPGRAEVLEFYAALGANPDTAIEGVFAGDTVDSDTIAPERGVAVPGAVAGLLAALERYGTLSRARVLAPAISLARDGFIVQPLLARAVENAEEKLRHAPEAAALFLPGDEPIQPGDRLIQTGLARSLEAVAAGGADAFYRGPLTAEMVRVLRAGGSTLTEADFGAYTPNHRRPLCTGYREYAVLSAPPPMGGVVLLEALNLIERTDLPAIGPPVSSPRALGLVADAIRVARADRAAWSGDPDDTAVPGAGLASDAFAAERSHLLGRAPPDTVPPGDPWDEDARGPEPGCAALDPFPPSRLPRPVTTGASPVPELPQGASDDDASHTTHISVVDAGGNAVSLTYTMGLYFGTGAYAAGMFLNSAGYNFDDHPPAAKRAPYRTANSTIAPTLVLEGDDVRLAVGSPGSGRISPAILHTILYTLDFGYDPGRAISLPRIYPWTTEAVVQVEPGFAPEALAGLRDRGYTLVPHPPLDMYFGGVHAILVRPDGTLVGVADPRRDGAARGY